MTPHSILHDFLHLFFPDCCCVCGNKLNVSENGICLECLYKLPKTNNFKIPGNKAEELMAGRFPFQRIASFCVYTKDGILQKLVHQFKYNNRKEIAIMLGRLFANDILGSEFISSIDLIVPVPLHPKRLKIRGYNQSELIARGMSEVTEISVSSSNLIRSIYNPTQTKRSRTQRWENVKDIFELRNINEFANKHVLLVDDVITTGSTIEACSIPILKCNNVKISIATLGEVF
ncbi:MAG: ComF family protein [Dysgonamonadaceae bacterium]|nr:ComF family protein [Dysgonamonadaceae bacterium]MDD4399419.1 ComF family protein [Dysgonamonadaceae bacterium]